MPACEPKHSGNKISRKALNRNIHLSHCAIIKAPRHFDLVLCLGELGLKLLEVFVGFEVWIVFRQGYELSDGRGERAFL